MNDYKEHKEKEKEEESEVFKEEPEVETAVENDEEFENCNKQERIGEHYLTKDEEGVTNKPEEDDAELDIGKLK